MIRLTKSSITSGAALPALLFIGPAFAAPAIAQDAIPASAPAGDARAGAAQEHVPGFGVIREDAKLLMSFKMGDMANNVAHPKDAGLRRAFALLDDRLAELPRELANEMPPEMLELFSQESIPVWLRLLKVPKSMAFGLSQSQAQETYNPMVFGLSVHEDSPEAAAALEANLRGLFTRMGEPAPRNVFGAEGSDLTMRFGAAPSANVAPLARALVTDAPMTAEMSIDVGEAWSFGQMMMAQEGAPPELTMLLGQVFERMGLDQLKIELAQTNDGKHAHTATVMTGIAGKMKAAGMIPEGGITAAHLQPIPADATSASASRMDLGAAFDSLNSLVKELSGEMTGEPIDVAEVVMAFNVDLRDGFFGALGDTYGSYTSMTTGGGGLTSLVMYASVRDADALTETKETIEDLLNSMTAPMTRGYVSARSWMNGDIEYTTLMFPGLPVPFEPTIAMSEQWMVLAATPQAAIAAMRQAHSEAPSIATRPEIAALCDGSKMGVSFVDTAYFANEGYGLTCIAMGAISNAVRSPMDATREPGIVVPTYSEFMAGIAPTVASTEIHGDDLVSIGSTDGSTVVSTAMMMGILSDYAPIIALPLIGAFAGEDIARELERNF